MAATDLEILGTLISCDTTSHKSNLNLMHYVQDYLSNYNIQSHLIESQDGEKANLHAVIGPADKPGIVLSGHTDVVPVAGQVWETNPFKMQERNGKLYGRGTCDMKGFIAAVLAKVPQMVQADLNMPFHLALSYDEEVGCTGVGSLIDFLDAELEVKPKMCIVGEPTMMQPINAHKGGHHVHCRIAGRECHSSLAPYGVNALEYGGALIAYINKVSARIRENGPFNPDFDPPYTTMNIGLFNGGTALNIVPNEAELQFALRPIPEDDAQAIVDEIREYAFKILEPKMKAIDPKSGFTFSEPVKIPSFSSDEKGEVVQLALNLTGSNTPAKVSFATEAGLFQASGIPTVVCGPGSIEQAHKADEFIAVSEMEKCSAFLGALVKNATHN